jgi:hypothetical protein
MEKFKIKYDVKTSLANHMPSLVRLLGEQNIAWSSINKNLLKYINEVKVEFISTKIPIEREATFYSILVRKFFGKGDTDAMFDFYDKTFVSLNKVLTEIEKKPLHRMISKVLSNLNHNYLNFIGELATLNKFMDTGEYHLNDIEKIIHPEKNKGADISLIRKMDNIEVLIEVLNIHLETKKFENYDQLEYHLQSKFENKSKDKFINPKIIIFIQPIIWTSDLEQLNMVCKFYSETNFKMENVIVPMSYLTFKHTDGKFEHRFESLKTILND